VLFRRLWAWLTRGRNTNAADVRLLTRAGCHLCDLAWKQLVAAQRRYRFRLTIVDVDADAALRQEHGDHVPVVLLNGKVRFRGVVNAILLERLLQSEVAHRPGA
jgi:Glutaredoxin-like domain (DUF836)